MRCNAMGRIVAAAALVAAGCGGANAGPKRPTGTLKGTLTIGGAAVPARTALVIQSVATGKLFVAETDANGGFEVLTPERQMPTGRYDVLVRPSGATDKSGREAAENALGDTPRDKAAPPPMEIPKRYLQPHTSGMGFELVEGANERAFDLKR